MERGPRKRVVQGNFSPHLPHCFSSQDHYRDYALPVIQVWGGYLGNFLLWVELGLGLSFCFREILTQPLHAWSLHGHWWVGSVHLEWCSHFYSWMNQEGEVGCSGGRLFAKVHSCCHVIWGSALRQYLKCNHEFKFLILEATNIVCVGIAWVFITEACGRILGISNSR